VDLGRKMGWAFKWRSVLAEKENYERKMIATETTIKNYLF
jgi:hypothetical protein